MLTTVLISIFFGSPLFAETTGTPSGSSEATSDVYSALWVVNNTRAWAVNKPRIYNRVEVIMTCRKPNTQAHRSETYQYYPGFSAQVTFPTLNQHDQFANSESERAYFRAILEENRQVLSRNGFEWVNSDQTDCGMPPQQEGIRDPVMEFEACLFRPRG